MRSHYPLLRILLAQPVSYAQPFEGKEGTLKASHTKTNSYPFEALLSILLAKKRYQYPFLVLRRSFTKKGYWYLFFEGWYPKLLKSKILMEKKGH